MVFDKAGNLYGTTYNGGTANLAAVFELTLSERQYSVDAWLREIRPIVDQKVGRWYWS